MEINEKVIAIEKKLRANGYKYTHSRNAIIKLLAETTEHLKCEEIYRRLREDGVSLPTVYRNIDIFNRLGIIKEVMIHNERYFELNIYTQKKLHIHFHCQQCGKIKEYSDRQDFKGMIQLKTTMENKYKDAIEDISIVMTGVCVDCQKKLKGSMNL